jgi:hypothetical protein
MAACACGLTTFRTREQLMQQRPELGVSNGELDHEIFPEKIQHYVFGW